MKMNTYNRTSKHLISGFVNENEDEHSRTRKCTNGFSMGSFERTKQQFNRFVKGFVKGFVKKETDGGFSIKIPTVICCRQRKPEQLSNFEGLFAAVHIKPEQLRKL